MSDWDDWLKCLKSDSQGTKCADECGIFDLDGNPWVATKGCCMGATGAEQIKKAISGGAGAQGKVHLSDGQKFMVLQNDKDQNLVVGRLGSAGFTAVKGKQCMVMSTFADANKVVPGNCRKQVEFVKKELIDGKGF